MKKKTLLGTFGKSRCKNNRFLQPALLVLVLAGLVCCATGGDAPKDAEYYYNRGNEFYDEAKYDQAIAEYTAALGSNPNYAEAYARRGRAYNAKEKYAEALEDCNAALRIDPKLAMAYATRGSAYVGKKLYDQALEDCNTALGIDPNYAPALGNRGNVYSRQGMYDKAIEEYTAALKIDPSYASVYGGRGIVYYLKGMYDQAIADSSVPVPASLTAEALSTDSIRVSWSAVEGASGYNLYRSSTASGTYAKLPAGPVAGVTHTDTGLTANSTYYYRVSAVKGGKEGGQSAAKNAKTLDVPKEPVEPEGATLAEKLAYIAGRADNGAAYDIVVSDDEYVNPISVSTRGRNVHITIRSATHCCPVES